MHEQQAANELIGELGRKGRFPLRLFIATVLGSFIAVPYLVVGVGSVANRVVGQMFRDAITKPIVIWDLGSQLLVLAGLHGIYFWIVAVLARPRVAPQRWYQESQFAVWTVGIASWWLILDWHNRIFPNSLWVRLLDPAELPIATMLLDLMCAVYLAGRFSRLVVAKVRGATSPGKRHL